MRETRGHWFTLTIMVLAGCGAGTPDDQPDTGPVTGVVRLDKVPLAGAKVEFQPDDGRPSMATTDAEGRYELDYTATVKGAKIGPHTVRVTTFQATNANDGSVNVITPEKVPDVYNTKSELKVEVEPGDNDIPIDIDSSKGRVVQP